MDTHDTDSGLAAQTAFLEQLQTLQYDWRAKALAANNPAAAAGCHQAAAMLGEVIKSLELLRTLEALRMKGGGPAR